jgi:hypothetical protein
MENKMKVEIWKYNPSKRKYERDMKVTSPLIKKIMFADRKKAKK